MLGTQVYNPSEDLDEDTLKQIAQITKGDFFRAKDPKQLNKIYDKINALEPIQLNHETIRPIKSYYYIPLFFAFLCFLLIGLMPFIKVLSDRFLRSKHA